jgi:hypothetical protein
LNGVIFRTFISTILTMKSNTSSWFLPVENYIIRTKLTEEQIVQRLNEFTKNTGVKSNASLFGFGTLFGQKSGGPYEGTIKSNEFKISRIISYRNSFLPVIRGSVSSFLNQREITISMGLNLFVKVFMIIWLSLSLFASLLILVEFLNGSVHTNWLPEKFIPLLMVVFGYVMMILAFKFESRKSKKDLNALFEAEAQL